VGSDPGPIEAEKSESNGIITTSTLLGKKLNAREEMVGTEGVGKISSSFQMSAATMSQSTRSVYHRPKRFDAATICKKYLFMY